MTVTVRIPAPLRALTGDRELVGAEGATLGEAIAHLDGAFPGLRERLCEDGGELRRFVNVFVNGEDVRFLDGLASPLADGDEVSIVPAVAGGAEAGVRNPPEGTQHVAPYLIYDDAEAAIGFLQRAFGFEERFRFPLPGGGIGHAELARGDSVLMLASANAALGLAGPRAFPARHGFVHVYVDDVDAHCARARAAGAEIAQEPEDKFYGDRSYLAADPEGHRWSFATRLRDVPPEELRAAAEAAGA